MISLVTSFVSNESKYEKIETYNKTRVADIALKIIFCVIALLAFNGLMPFGVGIAFVTLAILQIVGLFLAKARAEQS